jgi:hypothetical protein
MRSVRQAMSSIVKNGLYTQTPTGGKSVNNAPAGIDITARNAE